LKNALIALILSLIVIGIINLAFNYKDGGKNGALNQMVSDCEHAEAINDEAALSRCDNTLLATMQRDCNENPNYDICANTRIENYYYSRS
jgi:hypothetical protein